MAVSAIDSNAGFGQAAVDLTAVEAAENYTGYKYVNDVLSNRQFFLFSVPYNVLNVLSSFSTSIAESAKAVTSGLHKVCGIEDVVFVAQDLLAIPDQVKTLSQKVSLWWAGSTGPLAVANQVRKVAAHVLSTVGDYANAVDALKRMNINISPMFDQVSLKVGCWSSILGSSSKIADYATGDVQSSASALQPSLQNAKKTYEDSKNWWEMAMHVSVVAINVVILGVGPASPLVAFAGASILATRMVAYYRSNQLNAMTAAHPQMKAAKV